MSIILPKSYGGLLQFRTLEERFEYLRIPGVIGARTFGGDRYLNQILYTSSDWRSFREKVIIRDNGCDLAMPGYEIFKTLKDRSLNQNRGDYIIIHHINPITPEDIRNRDPKVFDMNNVVCTSPKTHRAIHFGDCKLLPQEYVPRYPNDTCPWKKV